LVRSRGRHPAPPTWTGSAGGSTRRPTTTRPDASWRRFLRGAGEPPRAGPGGVRRGDPSSRAPRRTRELPASEMMRVDIANAAGYHDTRRCRLGTSRSREVGRGQRNPEGGGDRPPSGISGRNRTSMTHSGSNRLPRASDGRGGGVQKPRDGGEGERSRVPRTLDKTEGVNIQLCPEWSRRGAFVGAPPPSRGGQDRQARFRGCPRQEDSAGGGDSGAPRVLFPPTSPLRTACMALAWSRSRTPVLAR